MIYRKALSQQDNLRVQIGSFPHPFPTESSHFGCKTVRHTYGIM